MCKREQQPGLPQDAHQSMNSTETTTGCLDNQESINKHLEDQVLDVEAQNETIQILIQAMKSGSEEVARSLLGKLRSKANLEDIIAFVHAQQTHATTGTLGACS